VHVEDPVQKMQEESNCPQKANCCFFSF